MKFKLIFILLFTTINHLFGGIVRNLKLTEEQRQELIIAKGLKSFSEYLSELLDRNNKEQLKDIKRRNFLDLKDAEGYNLLYYACLGNHINLIKYLLRKNNNLFSNKYQFGRNILHHAAKFGSPKIFELLLSNSLDWSDLVDTVDQDGTSVLHIACQCGNIEIAQIILHKSKKDINTVDKCGLTALDYAYINSHLETCDLILYQFPFSIYFKHNNGDTILHYVARMGNNHVATRLFEQYPNLAITPNDNGLLPIHLACEFGNIKMVELYIIYFNRLIEACDSEGNNFLHYACQFEYPEIINLLMSSYPDLITIKNKAGLTPLDISHLHENFKNAKFILNKINKYRNSI